jgi:hypothetical protein
MRRVLPLLAALLLLIAYGVAEGLWTNRWQLSKAVEEATARLRNVPLRVGDWQGRQRTLDARQVARAEMGGYLLRDYVHRETGQEVSVLLVCGRAGPTALHSPEVCYGGAGYAPAAPPARQALAGGEFWGARFRKSGPAAEALQIYWSWNVDGRWQAPDSPRLHFAGQPALYKLYVIRRVVGAEGSAADGPCREFLDGLLPELQRALFTAPAASRPGT